VSAHWVGTKQDVLEGEDGIRTGGLAVPMLCEEVEDGDGEGEVSAAPSAFLVTLPVGAQAFHLLALA